MSKQSRQPVYHARTKSTFGSAAKPAKRFGKVRQQHRGASSVKQSRSPVASLYLVVRALCNAVKAFPWRPCCLHLSIFGFWLLVLTGAVFGARWADQPISRIEVVGDFKQIRQQVVEAELTAALEKSFFTFDLSDIQQQLENRAWVHTANVERQWPGILQVELLEEQALAEWNDRGFVSTEGKVVMLPDSPGLDHLPAFYGEHEHAALMLSTFNQWQSQLATVELKIDSLRLTKRGAWQIGFAGDWMLNLGKAQVDERLQRFIAVYGKRLYQDADNIRAIDARYTQGVSVTWKALPELTAVSSK